MRPGAIMINVVCLHLVSIMHQLSEVTLETIAAYNEMVLNKTTQPEDSVLEVMGKSCATAR